MDLNEVIEKQTIIDKTTTPGSTYICKSNLGTPLTDSRWSIVKIDADGNKQYPKDIVRGIISNREEFLPGSIGTYTFAYNY